MSANTAAHTGQQPAPGIDGPRQVRLTLTTIEPWTAAKVGFVLSIALGIMLVIASAILWFLLDSMHVFAAIEDLFVSVGSESFGRLIDYARLDRVLAVTALVSILNVVLLTALSALVAFLYNLTSSLVGGLRVTMTDD